MDPGLAFTDHVPSTAAPVVGLPVVALSGDQASTATLVVEPAFAPVSVGDGTSVAYNTVGEPVFGPFVAADQFPAPAPLAVQPSLAPISAAAGQTVSITGLNTYSNDGQLSSRNQGIATVVPVVEPRLVTPFSAGDQTVWVDATGFFSATCDELKIGELIHGENFSLFEAMSALEILDPKMDAGMTTTGYKSVEEAVDKGAAPVDLTVPQIIDVMDHLFSCEATWHKGHSLAQTVFSCLYLLKADRTTPNALLHAYCKITRATCNLVRTAVVQSDIHEEEDFVTFGFGLPLEGEGDSKCLSTLNAVEEQLARQLRGCKGQNLAKKEVAEELEPLQNGPDSEGLSINALLCRLRFRKAFYHTLAYMEKPLGRGFKTAQKHIKKALEELLAVKASTEFLRVHESILGDSATTASGLAAVGFDESVNGRLLAPTPPRTINILSWSETLAYFEQLLKNLDQICSMSGDLELEDVLQYIVDFQRAHPDLVARAYLQLISLQDGKLLGRETMTTAISKVLKRSNKAATETETFNFLQQTGKVAVQLVKIMCTNLAWQRRKLGRVILEWGMVLEQAELSVQGASNSGLEEKALTIPPPAGGIDDSAMSWAAEQLCWMVAYYLLLGFELELYALNEFCMVYWYLDHALLSFLHYKVLRERRASESEHLKSNDSAVESAKKKGKKKKGGSVKASVNKEVRFTPGVALLQCFSDLCKGYVWMLTALTADRKILYRGTYFNSELERYIQRFELFHRILVPEPMTYLDYRESMMHRRRTIKELYEVAFEHFTAALQRIQELSQAVSKATTMEAFSKVQRTADIRHLEQTTLRNRVALQIAHHAAPGDSLRVSFEFSQHPCFPVAVVKKS